MSPLCWRSCSSPGSGPVSRSPTGTRSGELFAQVLEDPRQQPRDLHLRHADVLSDLLLGPAVEEPQLENASVTGSELAHRGAEHDSGLGAGELHALVRHQVAEGRRAVLPHGYVERGRCERAVGGECLDHRLDVEPEQLRDLGGTWRATELMRELARRLGDLALQLLDPAGRAHGPTEVAKVPLDLARHGGHRVREEVTLVAGVEAVDGLHQTDIRRLDEVVLGEAALAVAVGDRPSHAHVEHDDLRAQRRTLALVVGAVQLPQQPCGGLAAICFRVRLGGGSTNGRIMRAGELMAQGHGSGPTSVHTETWRLLDHSPESSTRQRQRQVEYTS